MSDIETKVADLLARRAAEAETRVQLDSVYAESGRRQTGAIANQRPARGARLIAAAAAAFALVVISAVWVGRDTDAEIDAALRAQDSMEAGTRLPVDEFVQLSLQPLDEPTQTLDETALLLEGEMVGRFEAGPPSGLIRALHPTDALTFCLASPRGYACLGSGEGTPTVISTDGEEVAGSAITGEPNDPFIFNDGSAVLIGQLPDSAEQVEVKLGDTTYVQNPIGGAVAVPLAADVDLISIDAVDLNGTVVYQEQIDLEAPSDDRIEFEGDEPSIVPQPTRLLVDETGSLSPEEMSEVYEACGASLMPLIDLFGWDLANADFAVIRPPEESWFYFLSIEGGDVWSCKVHQRAASYEVLQVARGSGFESILQDETIHLLIRTWQGDEDGNGPGAFAFLGQVGDAVAEVHVELENGTRILADIVDNWLVVDGRIDDETDVFNQTLVWTLNDGTTQSADAADLVAD